MNTRNVRNARWILAMALGVLSSTALVACGGAGSDSGPSTSPTSGTIAGTATKGPVSGATVRAYAINNGV